jgi:replicative DNA helicase
MSNFQSAISQLKYADDRRKETKNLLPLGIPYFDSAIGGILPDDLIIITARTGSGKTEIATLITQTALKLGKIVNFFALEAYKGEIESRIKFKLLANAFYSQKDFKHYGRTPNYHDWRRGTNDDLTEKFEPEVDEILSKQLVNLFTCYRETSFTPEDFEKEILKVRDFMEADLIILDHLHFFDFDSENENAAMKATVKRIRQISATIRKPIVMLAQLRKRDKSIKSIVPDSEEILGSSDIAKMATIILSTAPAFDQPSTQSHLFATYLRVCKNRDDSSRTRYVGLGFFNIRDNSYQDEYRLGKLSIDESKFEELEGEWPEWARRDRKTK